MTTKNNQVMKLLQIILFILVWALPASAILYFLKLSSVKFIGSEFLLGYLGVFLGFAFSVIAFDLSVLDKVKDGIEKDSAYTVNEKAETKLRIKALVEEWSDNLLFLFFSFLFIVLVMVLEVWNIPEISIPIESWYSKTSILNAIKFSIFGLSVYALYDLLLSTFRLYEKVDEMRNRNSATQQP